EVPWAERSVRSPDCRRVRLHAEPEFANLHYANHYWLNEPIEQSIRAFRELGEMTRQMGRRPDIPISTRPVTSLFAPIKGYVNPRVLVSADVLPFRPARGIFLNVFDLLDPNSADAHDMFAWYDEVHIPDILECHGFAGCWTFISDPSWESGRRDLAPPSRRIHLFYLDEDPVDAVA